MNAHLSVGQGSPTPSPYRGYTITVLPGANPVYDWPHNVQIRFAGDPDVICSEPTAEAATALIDSWLENRDQT